MSIDLTKPVSKITVDGDNLPLYHNLETKIVTPSTSQQEIYPQSEYDGIGEIICQAVTSSIDNNIQPENIKKDVTVLGVTGILISGVSPTAHLVKVIDYDGTILKEEYLESGETFTLPSLPSHSRLTFNSWISTKEIINNQVVVDDDDIRISPSYLPTSGMSEFDIELNSTTGLSVELRINGTKDWGDGTSDTTTSHTYADYGKYTIKTDGSTITITSYNNIFGTGNPGQNYYCVAVYLNNNITDIHYAFRNCYSLKYVTLPSSITSGDYAFMNCYSLKTVSLKKIFTSEVYNCYNLENAILDYSITSISNTSNIFYNCYSLTELILPSNLVSLNTPLSQYSQVKKIHLPKSILSYSSGVIGNALESINIPNRITSSSQFMIGYNVALKEILIEEGVTSLPSNILSGTNNYSITKIKFPKTMLSVNNIFSGTFNQIITLDFTSFEAVPTLSSATAFSGLNSLFKIVIPDSLYNSWIADTSWSNYINNIVKASDYSN